MTVEFGEDDGLVRGLSKPPCVHAARASQLFLPLLTLLSIWGQDNVDKMTFVLLRDRVNVHQFFGHSANPQESLHIRIEFSRPVSRAFPVMVLVRCVVGGPPPSEPDSSKRVSCKPGNEIHFPRSPEARGLTKLWDIVICLGSKLPALFP